MGDLVLLIIVLSLILGAFVIDNIEAYLWRKKPLRNFPFKWKGKEYWYSRSVAVTGIVLAKNNNDEWCVLANKRGKGTPDFQGYWNIPCGYLDFNETSKQAVSREIHEECGVLIPHESFELYGIEDSPLANLQNVTIRYITKLEHKCEEFSFSNENSEINEVDSIKWIPLNEIDNYKWAFNHLNLLKGLDVK